MKIQQVYSHLNGIEFIKYHKPKLWDEIVDVIEGVNAKLLRTKISKEVRIKGKRLYAPKLLNKEFQAKFHAKNWRESRVSYWVTPDAKLIRKTMFLGPDEQKKAIVEAGQEPIRSYNQTDFVKERIAIELQFGKYAF
ncbi:MAG TPA: BglII/BstYI family type II restriction endonuclease, partial [Bacteroidota bacterium]|nr:BglII/BstYI family type II restriction endonuclease [Bacteroidota bacterium]